MNDKKLLLITPDFPPNEGGVARYLSALASHFNKRIEVLTDPNPNWYATDPLAGYPIYRASLLSNFIWPRWLKTVVYLWKYRSRYDLILTSHVLPIGTAAWFAKKFTGDKYVVFAHGMDIRLARANARKRRLTEKVLKGAQLVVANSNALASEIAEVFGITEILVVYPCVPSTLPPKRIPSSAFTLLTVSRLVKRKGHSHVLNALARLKVTGQLRDFQYHIVGEGPMEASLKSMSKTLNLESHVVFHGAVSDEQRNELYAQSDVFVMPVSQDPVDKEGFGLVYIEAARAGLPSIATNVPGVDEAVLNGQTGILLTSQDEQQLANAILKLAQNEELLTKMRVVAMDHAKGFTCDTQMGKLDAYL